MKDPLDLEQETHDRVAELEQYVYDNTEPYVYFGEPSIDDENLTADLYLIQTERHHDTALYESARCLVNEYLRFHPECFLNSGYKIMLHYIRRNAIPDDYSDLHEGYATNSLYFSGHTEEGYVDYDQILDQLVVVRCTYEYQHTNLYSSSELQGLDVRGNRLTYEQILEVTYNLVGLKYLYLSSFDGDIDALIEDTRNINPDIELIWKYD